MTRSSFIAREDIGNAVLTQFGEVVIGHSFCENDNSGVVIGPMGVDLELSNN